MFIRIIKADLEMTKENRTTINQKNLRENIIIQYDYIAQRKSYFKSFLLRLDVHILKSVVDLCKLLS